MAKKKGEGDKKKLKLADRLKLKRVADESFAGKQTTHRPDLTRAVVLCARIEGVVILTQRHNQGKNGDSDSFTKEDEAQ